MYTPVVISTPPPLLRPLSRPSRLRGLRDRQRRFLNVAVASVGIILTLPLMLIIALAVKLTSRGPVFYSQHRVGIDQRSRRGPEAMNGRRREDRGGRIFRIYKFRSMTTAASKEQVWASSDDSRITLIGGFLRKYRLDELPQLFNVLLGDMNIVGPRPEQPDIFRQLRKEVDGYGRRQRVLPGITGWAQVNQRYDHCIDDVRRKVDFDLEYMRRRSTSEDLKIMMKTVPVMVGKKGSV